METNQTTGRPSRPSCSTRGQGNKTAGPTKRRKHSRQQEPFMVMHWNAESVTNKKTELEHILHERNIPICCIQEIHLQSDKSFKVRGYQCFRYDRTDRNKGGVLTLVRNNIQACLISSHMEDSEYQVLKLQASNAELKLVNFYCPNNKPLSLDSISICLLYTSPSPRDLSTSRMPSSA